jgi:hypothetical protein
VLRGDYFTTAVLCLHLDLEREIDLASELRQDDDILGGKGAVYGEPAHLCHEVGVSGASGGAITPTNCIDSAGVDLHAGVYHER